MTVQDGMAYNPHRRPRSDSTDSNRSHDSHENEENAAIALWMYTVLVASVPLLYMGNTKTAVCFMLIGAVYRYIDYFVRPIPEADKIMMRYNIYEPHDVLIDVVKQQKKFLDQTVSRNHYQTSVLSAISSLAKKYGTLQLQKKHSKSMNDSETQSKSTGKKECEDKVLQHTALICQEAAYLGLVTLDGDDEVIETAFALIALVAKSSAVRERHLQKADKFGFDVLISAMNASLSRAKSCDDESQEQRLAELQRKGCLMLGALADNDAAMADQIVREGGLTSILAAMSWYRFHDEMAGWGLWSVFTMCYENNSNMYSMIEEHGVPTIIRTMKNCNKSVEVTRHGTAIMFDLLRRNRCEATTNDPMIQRVNWKQVRDVALNEGLHDVVTSAIENFSEQKDTVDIVLMARELLAGIEGIKR